MSDKKITNVKELLSAIDAANKQTTYDIYIPSLKRSVVFHDITTGQQKQMIRALIDNPVYRTNFIIAFYDIIKANCAEAALVDEFNIYDKLAIALQLRRVIIGPKVTVEVETETRPLASVVDLEPINFVSHFSNLAIDSHPADSFEYNGIVVKCKVPTMAREARLERELRAKVSDMELKSYEDVRGVIGDAYIGELSKFISTISINGETIDVQAPGFTFKQLYDVLDVLPTQLVRKVITYLELIQDDLVKLATFEGTAFSVNKAESVKVNTVITIDAAFFTGK